MTRLAPWAGWIGGIAGWLVSQQGGSTLSQLDCRAANPGVILAIGVVGAVLAVGGGLLSWRTWREVSHDDIQARRFVAATGGLAAAIFLFAIGFQTLAALIIPRCHA
jgi:hypothetical protein